MSENINYNKMASYLRDSVKADTKSNRALDSFIENSEATTLAKILNSGNRGFFFKFLPIFIFSFSALLLLTSLILHINVINSEDLQTNLNQVTELTANTDHSEQSFYIEMDQDLANLANL